MIDFESLDKVHSLLVQLCHEFDYIVCAERVVVVKKAIPCRQFLYEADSIEELLGMLEEEHETKMNSIGKLPLGAIE